MDKFREGLAEILQVKESALTPSLELTGENWDSIAIVSTLVLIDECFNKVVEGTDLAKCQTVADIEAMATAQEA